MFGIDDALLGSAAGSLVGGLLGGKKQKSTQQTRPYLPEDYEAGYKTLLAEGMKEFQTPRNQPVTMRVANPTSNFDKLFGSPELQAIQQNSDNNFFAQLMGGGAPSSTAPAQSNDTDKLLATNFLRNSPIGNTLSVNYGDKILNNPQALSSLVNLARLAPQAQQLDYGAGLKGGSGHYASIMKAMGV